jgi:hypothetical protein
MSLESILRQFDSTYTSGLYLNPYIIGVRLDGVLKCISKSVLHPVRNLTLLINDINHENNVEFVSLRDKLIQSRQLIIDGDLCTARENLYRILLKYSDVRWLKIHHYELYKKYMRSKWSLLRASMKFLSLHSRAVVTANHPSRIDFSIREDFF